MYVLFRFSGPKMQKPHLISKVHSVLKFRSLSQITLFFREIIQVHVDKYCKQWEKRDQSQGFSPAKKNNHSI